MDRHSIYDFYSYNLVCIPDKHLLNHLLVLFISGSPTLKKLFFVRLPKSKHLQSNYNMAYCYLAILLLSRIASNSDIFKSLAILSHYLLILSFFTINSMFVYFWMLNYLLNNRFTHKGHLVFRLLEYLFNDFIKPT